MDGLVLSPDAVIRDLPVTVIRPADGGTTTEHRLFADMRVMPRPLARQLDTYIRALAAAAASDGEWPSVPDALADLSIDPDIDSYDSAILRWTVADVRGFKATDGAPLTWAAVRETALADDGIVTGLITTYVTLRESAQGKSGSSSGSRDGGPGAAKPRKRR